MWKKGIKDAPAPSVLQLEFTGDRPWWFTWQCPCAGSAAWEMQTSGSERVQLLQCLTGSINFPWKGATGRVATLACDLDGEIIMLHKEIQNAGIWVTAWQGL